MALTFYFTAPTSGAINTKGVYTQVVAATPYASSRLYLSLTSSSAARRFFLVDLATGGAGAESVIVANMAVDCDSDNIAGSVVALDVDIPAGTRLAVRCQSLTASQLLNVIVHLEDRALGGLATPVTYGTFTNSGGTSIDPGTTINTKGSYVQFSASTPARIDALAVCATSFQQGQTFTAFTDWYLDVATGAGGAETVVLPDLPFSGGVNADTVRPGFRRLPVAIPAGTRLAVRCQCNRNTAFERNLCVTLIGMQEPASGGGSAAGAVAYVG